MHSKHFICGFIGRTVLSLNEFMQLQMHGSSNPSGLSQDHWRTAQHKQKSELQTPSVPQGATSCDLLSLEQVLIYLMEFIVNYVLTPEAQKMTRMDVQGIGMAFAACLMVSPSLDIATMM